MEKKTSAAAVAAACLLLSGVAIAHAAQAVTPAAASVAAADAQFKAIYTQEWKWRLTQHLEEGQDDDGGVGADLPHVDARTQQARLVYWQGVMKKLDAVAPSRLSAGEKVNYAVYRAQIAALVSAQQFREYEKPLNADTAFWSNVADDARGNFTNVAQYQAYIKRLRDMPRYFSEETANMRAGLARGF